MKNLNYYDVLPPGNIQGYEWKFHAESGVWYVDGYNGWIIHHRYNGYDPNIDGYRKTKD